MVRKTGTQLIKRRIKPFVKGITAGAASALIFAVIFAALYKTAGAPSGTDVLFGYITAIISCFICGMFIGGGKRSNGFFWGAVGGLILFALCCICAALIGNLNGGSFAAKLPISIISGSVGGIAGVNLTLKSGLR